MELYHIVQLVIALIAGVLYILQRCFGFNALEKIVHWKPVLISLGVMLKAVSGAMPGSELKSVIAIFEAACAGAETAENLWLMGKLPKEERNAHANALIAGVLEDAGIEVTPQIQMIVAGAIEMICMLMPHGQEPKTQPESEAEEVC